MSQKPTILLVDDDPDIIEQLTLMLESEGYRLLTAASREEAENLLTTCIPDLAIVDLMMEEMDAGFVLCHEIKRLYPDTPVIIHTAVTAATGLAFPAGTPEERSWVKADAFLDKPLRPEQLRQQVRQLLARPAAAPTH